MSAESPIATALSNRWLREGGPRRRELLRGILSVAALSMAPQPSLRAQESKPRFTAYPFSLGVASGYPRADGVTLWTRLAPEPLQSEGGIDRDETIPVTWQVAEQENFQRIVAEGRIKAVGELSHSVHVDVVGLRPERPYFYRFMAGDEVSPTGRTKTAPGASSNPARLRFAIGSCQHYEQGFFHAYRHILEDEPDLMIFLGDYIYESSWGEPFVRRHAGGEPYDLGDYRVRHAQYKSDPDLQRAHGAIPWLVTWDDHEVDNDLAGDQSEHLDPRFLLRRAAAYQAYYEHMPLPATMRPSVHGEMRIYTALDYGALARIHVLDDRQYRTPQPCPDTYKGGGSTMVDPSACAALASNHATLLGQAQERWLAESLGASKARWNVIAQQTLMTEKDDDPGVGKKVWTDGWDGYPATRSRLYDVIERGGPAASPVPNVLVVGGDIHATVAADLKRDPWDSKSPIIASEICGTSMTAQGPAQIEHDKRLQTNPQIKYARSDRRGYCLFTLADAVRVDVRALASEKIRDSGVETIARLVVEDRNPGVQDA